eukprot:Clim_evm12s198 gene=Clim_evmTU12s198
MADEMERVILVKPEVWVYQIPPRTTTRGQRAADWGLSSPMWKGRLRVMSKGKDLTVKMEDASSGQLFAAAPVDEFPGPAVEQVTDSSRYFVLRVSDGDRHAFIGMGFLDRSDSFDFQVTLQDHFKHVKQEEEMASIPAAERLQNYTPKHDVHSLGTNETIKVNIKIGNKGAGGSQKPKSMGSGILPPPPGGGGFGLPPPPGSNVPPPPQAQNQFGNFNMPPPAGQQQQKASGSGQQNDEWDDFASAFGSGSNQNKGW